MKSSRFCSNSASCHQQQTLSLRISDELRESLEQAQQVISNGGRESVSISDIAKTLLESAKKALPRAGWRLRRVRGAAIVLERSGCSRSVRMGGDELAGGPGDQRRRNYNQHSQDRRHPLLEVKPLALRSAISFMIEEGIPPLWTARQDVMGNVRHFYRHLAAEIDSDQCLIGIGQLA
jgi:hypothetical protein